MQASAVTAEFPAVAARHRRDAGSLALLAWVVLVGLGRAVTRIALATVSTTVLSDSIRCDALSDPKATHGIKPALERSDFVSRRHRQGTDNMAKRVPEIIAFFLDPTPKTYQFR